MAERRALSVNTSRAVKLADGLAATFLFPCQEGQAQVSVVLAWLKIVECDR